MQGDVTPSAIVDRQRCAYNARDIEAYCALFARDALICSLSKNKEIARGIDAIRTGYAARFRESPSLHYDIKCRIELGRFVADHELVTGIGEGVLEVIAIYEVHDALIQSVRFIER